MRNKASVAAHELDYTDAIIARDSFCVRSTNHLGCHLDGGVEPEAIIDQRNVVINRLWNTCEADHDISLARPLDQSIDATVGTISTNQIDLIYAALYEAVQDLVSIKAATA